MASIDPSEAQAIREAYGKLSDRQLAEIVTANGYRVGYSTIAGHRRGECMTCRS